MRVLIRILVRSSVMLVLLNQYVRAQDAEKIVLMVKDSSPLKFTF